jgi:hypothetical protein
MGEQKTIDMVRQILMNELGLSREGVREEMKAIVRETAEKHFETLVSNGRLQEALVAAATKIIRDEQKKPTYNNTPAMIDLVRIAAREAAERFVKDYIRMVRIDHSQKKV